VVAVLALGLALMPRPVQAGPAPVGPVEATAPASPASPTPPAEVVDETPPTDDAAIDEAAEEDREGEADDDAAAEEDREGEADDDAAAEEDREGEAADDAAEASGEEKTARAPDAADDDDDDATDDAAPGALGPTAEPLRPLQTAAWWTMFSAFAVGTTAGVLAGLAERQEDRATRLSTLFDAQTGAQPLYADRRDEYEQYLRRGEGYAKAAIGVGVIAGVATVAAITLFAVDARRQRGDAAPKERRRASLRVRGGGVEVRF
jgi:hypothetical protein